MRAGLGGERTKSGVELFIVGDGGVLLVVATQHAHGESDLLERGLVAQSLVPGSMPQRSVKAMGEEGARRVGSVGRIFEGDVSAGFVSTS